MIWLVLMIWLIGKEAGRLMIERSGEGRRSEGFSESEEEFVAGMEEIVAIHGAKNFRLDKVRFGQVLQDVLYLVYKHNVPIETNFSTLVLSFVIAEGILRQLDASLNIFNVAIPMIYRADPEYKRRFINRI